MESPPESGRFTPELHQGLSKTVTAGVASFTGRQLEVPVLGYWSLAPSVPVLAPATSNAFDVALRPADRLGCGHAGTTNDRDGLDQAEMAQYAAAFLGALGARQADVVGFSAGGVIGIYLALAQPELVASLMTIGSHIAIGLARRRACPRFPGSR